jgi:small-conductance mechanosensitive channel
VARKKRTQIVVFNRITVAIVAVIAAAAMLTTFRQVRALGASLLASAGIAGLAAGVAAKPTLGNLVAGLQIAFTEPIRLDDVVVVEGEWGRIEEITLTYVVVRLWDTRRLVVPISYFVERPFQNWTRSTSDLIGSAIFHFDYRVPLDEVRREFESIVATSSRWDRRIAVMQVTDTTHHSIEVRALVSAPDSATAFDLRCEVRERLVSWLQANHPEALPRMRTELVEAATPASPASAASPAFVGQATPER